MFDSDEHDDYDAGWEEIHDSGDFGEWMLDDDRSDPELHATELHGTDLHDELLSDYDHQPDEDWAEDEAWDAAETGAATYGSLVQATTSDPLPPGAIRFGPRPAARLDTPYDPEVWHLTHFYNFQLMCARGAIAPTPTCPWGVRPGLRDLVGKRARRPTELGPAVGDCVPFYFTPATPFSYRILAPGWSAELIEPEGTRTIRTWASHYVFLRATIRQVVHEGAGDWMVTNGNAGAQATQAWRSLNHLHCIDWAAVTARWSSTNQANRQAELLVNRDVPLRVLTSIHTATPEMATKVRAVAGQWTERVVADPALFARARGR